MVGSFAAQQALGLGQIIRRLAFKIGGSEITVAPALSGAKLPPAMVNPRQILRLLAAHPCRAPATSGHLGRRGTGDVDTLTVREYRSLPAWRRALYRLKRHPIVLLGLGPFYVFVLKHRLPVQLMRAGREPWLSVMSTNLAIAAAAGLLMAILGVRDFLLVQAPITLLASSAGVWLFYVQHQFEHTYWERGADWNLRTGALHGSSHYDLPPVLRWFTANIGIHHVHHLASRIPCYRLGEALRAHPELQGVSRLTLKESFGCLRLALWDEDQRRLVGFREARSSAGA